MQSMLLLAAKEAAMKSVLMLSAATLLGQPVLSQTVYKCPPASPGGPPIFQQVPYRLGGARLKILRPYSLVGSSPTASTISK